MSGGALGSAHREHVEGRIESPHEEEEGAGQDRLLRQKQLLTRRGGATHTENAGRVTVVFSREVWKRNEHSGLISRRRGRSPPRTAGKGEAPASPAVVDVFPGETVRELCERLLVDPFGQSGDKDNKGLPEVTWANTCLPLSEHLDQLTVTKPWQLNLKEGKDVLTMTVPPGVEVRDLHPSNHVAHADRTMGYEAKQDRALTPEPERRAQSDLNATHPDLSVQNRADEALDKEDDFRSAENDQEGAVAADVLGGRDGEEVEEVTKKPTDAEPEPDAPSKSALSGALSVPFSGGSFSIRAAPRMVSAGMDLPPGEQVAEGKAPTSQVAPANDDAPASEAAAGPAAAAAAAAVPAVGNAGRAQREQRRPARLLDLDDGPQLAKKTTSKTGKDSANISAERSGDVAKSNAKTPSVGGVVAARDGASNGALAAEGTKEKARPHKNLANIYARAPEALGGHESSACSGDEMGEPDAIAEAAAAGLLAVAAAKEAPSRKRKAVNATRVSKDWAEAPTARGKSAAKEQPIEKPYKVRNYTKSSTLDAAERAAALAEQAERAAALARQQLEARGELEWWGGGNLRGAPPPQPHWSYGVQTQAQGMYGREPYDGPPRPYGVPAQGRLGMFPAPNQPQQMQAYGMASQLSQSSVGEIVSRFYKHKPPAPAERADPRFPPFEPKVLQSFQGQTRGWDSSTLHHVAAPLEERWDRGVGGGIGVGGVGRPVGRALEGLDAGMSANEAALRRWQNNMVQHAMAGHASPHGNFMVDLTEQSMFLPPPNRSAYDETLQKNQSQVSKLCDTMERLRHVVSSITEPVPSHMRMVIISRAQRLLEKISQSVHQIPPSEHHLLAVAVVEVQTWVQRQLRERMDEILITKPLSQPVNLSGAAKPHVEEVRKEWGKDAATAAGGDNHRRINDSMGPALNAGSRGGAGAQAQNNGADAEVSARSIPPVSTHAGSAAADAAEETTAGRSRENVAVGPPCNEDNEDNEDNDMETEDVAMSPTAGHDDDKTMTAGDGQAAMHDGGGDAGATTS